MKILVCTMACSCRLDHLTVSATEFIDTALQYKSARQVVFESFAERSISLLASCTPTATSRPPPLVLLTGGLNTLPRMASAVGHDHAHLLGIGRLSVLHPRLPLELSAALSSRDATFLRSDPPVPSELGEPPDSYLSWRALERAVWSVGLVLWPYIPARLPRILGATANVNWYNYIMRRYAFGEDVDFTVGTIGSVARFLLLPAPYPDKEYGEEGWLWWFTIVAGVVGVLLGMVLGQVV